MSDVTNSEATVTEEAVDTTPKYTPLEYATKRRSVAGVIQAFIAQENRVVHQDELIAYFAEHDFIGDAKQWVASMATLATTKKIDRGIEKGTFAPAGTVDEEARAAAKALRSEVAKAPREKKTRTPKEPKATYTNEQVFTHLIEQLGDNREYNRKNFGAPFVLLGDSSGAHILERAKLTTGEDPVAWSLNQVGPNVVVTILFK